MTANQENRAFRSHRRRIWLKTCSLALKRVNLAVATVFGQTARTRRRPGDSIRLLVEPSDYVLRNVGDMAMMQIAVERLAALWPDAEIHVLTNDPQGLAKLCPAATPLESEGRRVWLEEAFLPGRLQARLSPELIAVIRLQAPDLVRLFFRRKLRHDPDRRRALDRFTSTVANADAVIVAGMGGITDFFPQYARHLLMTLSLALHYQKAVVLVGQGIGPLASADLRELAGNVLRRVDMIALRECVTGIPLLESLGVSGERLVTTGDDAIETAYRARPVSLGAGVGINVRASSYSGIDLELVSRLRIELQKALQTLKVAAVPIPISRVSGESDIETLGTLIGDCHGASMSSPESGMPSEILEQLRHCRIVICGSYHAAVFACSSGIPAVCLTNSAYYDAKFGGLADLFGEGCEVISLSTPDFALRLHEAIQKNWNEAERLRPLLLQRAEAQMAMGRAAYQKIYDFLSIPFDRTTTEKR